MFEIEPIGRANRSAGGAVAGRQCRGHPLGRPSPGADPFKRANQTAHLIVQKTAGFDMKANLLALRVVMGGDIQKFIDELHIAENAERLKEGDDII